MRPELRTTKAPSGFTYESAFYRVFQAVKYRRALIHGQLHDGAKFCAIGATFDDGVDVLPLAVIDEVAAYNDSFPSLTPVKRWRRVRDWLEFRCDQMRKKNSATTPGR